ncbi:hypothetical protein ACP275_02G172100 [Erythranthe tilingii]
MEYQRFSIFYRGNIRVVFPNDKAAKILSFDFCTESFELRVPLQSEVGIYEGYTTLTPEMFNAYRDHHNFDVNSYIDVTCGLPISLSRCFLLERLEHRNSQLEESIAEHSISQLTLLYNHEKQHHASAMDYWEQFYSSHAIERLCFASMEGGNLIPM